MQAVLVRQNGDYVIVEKVQHEILEQPIAVYNFEVEDFHTYYVGESSVLVHNATCGPRISGVPKAESPVWNSLNKYKNGYRTSGSGKNQRFYSWDYLHNEIEVFDSNKKHLGAMDPVSGNMIKDPVPERRL